MFHSSPKQIKTKTVQFSKQSKIAILVIGLTYQDQENMWFFSFQVYASSLLCNSCKGNAVNEKLVQLHLVLDSSKGKQLNV